MLVLVSELFGFYHARKGAGVGNAVRDLGREEQKASVAGFGLACIYNRVIWDSHTGPDMITAFSSCPDIHWLSWGPANR